MALITDFASLKTAVTQYSWRAGDTEFETSVDGMIQLAGARLNRKLMLRVMEVDATATGVEDSRLLGLPIDFVEAYAFSLTTYGTPQDLTPRIAGDMPLQEQSGTPRYWCINGGSIQLDVPCDQAHTFLLRYRKSFVLSEVVPTNWLIQNHPDIYLAAVCTWGGVFMRDAEQAALQKGLLEEGLQELSWLESRSVSLAPLRMDAGLGSGGSFNIITG